MSLVPADRLPDDPEGLALRRDGRAILDAYRAFLQSPAFVHRIDLAVLTKLATDEAATHRVRARAAEILGNLFARGLADYASLVGVREASLRAQGIDAGPSEVNVTQVVQRIEIVREGAKDWRLPDGG